MMRMYSAWSLVAMPKIKQKVIREKEKVIIVTHILNLPGEFDQTHNKETDAQDHYLKSKRNA